MIGLADVHNSYGAESSKSRIFEVDLKHLEHAFHLPAQNQYFVFCISCR